MSTKIFYGEQQCQAIKNSNQQCTNKGYFLINDDQVVCGIHSKKFDDRVELSRRSEKEKKEIKTEQVKNHEKTVEDAAQQNRYNETCGNVILVKIESRKALVTHSGYLNVFPNFKHQNRTDGFGCSSLSPMSLGPVDHGQPDVDPALNLENFHQYSKCFLEEVDENENPSIIFVDNRIRGFSNTIPHRHKFTKKDKPLYSIWTDRDGFSHKIDYITSRQFYCSFYERLARKQDDFSYLKDLLENGYNLAIQGYDAYEIGSTPEEIEQTYLDPRRPFGHERCLKTMLVLNEESYPWRKYKTFEF